MARSREFGSLTKEYPLVLVDRTIAAIRPGMTYAELRRFASRTNAGIPGIFRKRYLLLDGHQIVYDRFLSLVNAEGIATPRVRKVMYFTHYYRDPRLRQFICERVANRAGLWQADELLDKRNSSFFEAFGESARKVRSNIENFLVEAGIFDRTTRTVHLDLNDGWLEEAVQAVAQHERDAANRRAMLASPAEYLIQKGWNGLANATVDQLRRFAAFVPMLPEPAEDATIPEPDLGPREGREWNRELPTPPARRAAAVVPNPVLRERAEASHFRLEELTARAVRSAGQTPRQTPLIDLYFKQPAGNVLCEMKSCTQGNMRHQIRRGIGQLLEYRFLHRRLLGNNPTLLLVTEIEPQGDRRWLVEYAMSVGIILAWKDPGENHLLTTVAIPLPLSGIVFPRP